MKPRWLACFCIVGAVTSMNVWAKEFKLHQSEAYFRNELKAEWNFIPDVLEFQKALDPRIQAQMERFSVRQLARGQVAAFKQKVRARSGQPKTMTVEYSRILIELPLEKVMANIPADQWGRKLSHYLGGEVLVLERDSLGRPIQQVERMVLSGFQDMVKFEWIEYGENKVTVYWKVIDSYNQSTEEDLGSLEIRAHGKDATVVTFHSAHRLKFLGVHVPHAIAGVSLSMFFHDHLIRYRAIAYRGAQVRAGDLY